MRSFRFPRSTILLMSLIFLATVRAIDEGRIIQELSSGDLHFETSWTHVFGLFAFFTLVMCSIGALGYLILCALRQSGAQRFANIRPRL